LLPYFERAAVVAGCVVWEGEGRSIASDDIVRFAFPTPKTFRSQLPPNGRTFDGSCLEDFIVTIVSHLPGKLEQLRPH